MEQKEELQKKYLQYQILKQQITGMLQERSSIEEKAAEIKVALETLKSLNASSAGKSLWSPVGAGMFAKASLEDAGSFMVSIGANVIVEETREKAITLLTEREEEAAKLAGEMDVLVAHYMKEIESLEEELQKLAK